MPLLFMSVGSNFYDSPGRTLFEIIQIDGNLTGDRPSSFLFMVKLTAVKNIDATGFREN